MAKLTKDFYAVPKGKIHPEWLKAGSEVSGAVEVEARAAGAVAGKAAPATKAATPPENKGA
ncbi:hypothetical protein [Maritimibacter alexandrii]|uniref:hypothetical protein n=1 Tax=Maritimibacter alexandrii TaxID=2570355 RepID=UPI001109235B|nr:hypothetical protein [Maritimibacter alexandrii]